MLLFSNLFSSKPPPPQFLLKMKRFASIKDCSSFLPLCDLPSSKNFRKISIFFIIFLFFFKCFRLREMGFFCCFQLGKSVFEIYAYPLGYFFGAVKLIKFKCHFTLGSPYDFAYLVFFKRFFQPSAQVFANHGFASVLILGGENFHL